MPGSQERPGQESVRAGTWAQSDLYSVRRNVTNTHVHKKHKYLLFCGKSLLCWKSTPLLDKIVIDFSLDINNLLRVVMFNLAQCFVIKVSQSDESIWPKTSN